MVQVASIARGCLELLRLAVARPRVVARVIRDVVFDYARDPRALVNGLAVVVLAASFVPAVRRRHVPTCMRTSPPNPLRRRGYSRHFPA